MKDDGDVSINSPFVYVNSAVSRNADKLRARIQREIASVSFLAVRTLPALCKYIYIYIVRNTYTFTLHYLFSYLVPYLLPWRFRLSSSFVYFYILRTARTMRETFNLAFFLFVCFFAAFGRRITFGF